ncbi:MAG: MarR family winged helix-turn-helix transcriptional regulator [Clostridium perfringens]|nr:MarR family winged helix-turn-helix transcriptional regulator [Clostridium perfringens]
MEFSMARNLSFIYRSYHKYMNKALKDINVCAGEFPILIALSRRDGLGQNELSRVVRMNKSLVSRHIQTLSSKGFINVNQEKEYSNKNILSLSDEGKKLMPKIITAKNNWEKEVLKDFTSKEKECFSNMLDKLLEASSNIIKE